MRNSHLMLLPVFVMIAVGLPVPQCLGQQAADSGQATPAVSGSGNAGRIAVWKNSTTLGNSALSQSGGNVGIGTSAPAAKLEVNGNAQVDGNFSLSGSILVNGAGTVFWTSPMGVDNLSVGLFALPTTTTGDYNTAVGAEALSNNGDGYDNTAIGFQALYANTSGFFNLASGVEALFNNTTGMVNTASGGQAMVNNTTGTGNTADGYLALGYNTTGYNNIAIGEWAGTNITTSSNNIDIGNVGAAADDGTIRIGAQSSIICHPCQTSTFIAGIYGSMTGLAGVPVVVDSNGQLGTVSSSRRYKEDIHDMGDTTKGLMKLRPVTFRYKKAFDDGSKPMQYGLIAEEVAEVYPDLVARSADGQVETIKYQLLDPMLLNELQRQHATITAQQEQIRSLEERLARIEAALERTSVTAAAR